MNHEDAPSVSPIEPPRRHARDVRIVARLGAFIVVAIVLATIGGRLRFQGRRARVYDGAVDVTGIVDDAKTLARGEHLARTIGGCAECHGEDLGGKLLGDDPMMRLVAPNLTRGDGGVVGGYTEADWMRAIVHGVDRSHHSLVVMPSKELGALSDADLGAIVAYARSVPPVDRSLGKPEIKPLGAVVLGLVNAPILSAEEVDHAAPRGVPAPEHGPTRAYGVYLANVCRGCHGADLRGGIVPHPGAPPSADISPTAMQGWSFEAFERTLREGVKRDGKPVDEAMPWRAMRALSPDEMRALWLGLRNE